MSSNKGTGSKRGENRFPRESSDPIPPQRVSIAGCGSYPSPLLIMCIELHMSYSEHPDRLIVSVLISMT